MPIAAEYQSDHQEIMSHRFDQGADYWTTPDLRLTKGSPFSTLECIMYLLELGVEPFDPYLLECADIIFSGWQDDGRFRVYPKGPVYPCHTAHAAMVLCHLGFVRDIRLQQTFQHLMDIQSADGGWRCNKFSFGRGPETEFSNPFPTLMALNAFRFTDHLKEAPMLNEAVDFLLQHWIIRKPIGPCHYGMGTLFMQVEYPFRTYNLFAYVYVLSFYQRAREDERFQEALRQLESKLVQGQVVVERVVPKLAQFVFCAKSKPSVLATRRYHEIVRNMT